MQAQGRRVEAGFWRGQRQRGHATGRRMRSGLAGHQPKRTCTPSAASAMLDAPAAVSVARSTARFSGTSSTWNEEQQNISTWSGGRHRAPSGGGRGGGGGGRLSAHGGPCRCSQGTSKVPHDRSQRRGTGVRAVRPVGGVTAPRPRLLAPAAPQPAVIWARTLTTRTPMPLDAHKRPCGAEVYRWCSGRMLAGLAGLLLVLLGGSRAQRARQQRRRSLRLGRIRACSRYDLLLRPLQGFSAHPSPPEHLISLFVAAGKAGPDMCPTSPSRRLQTTHLAPA